MHRGVLKKKVVKIYQTNHFGLLPTFCSAAFEICFFFYGSWGGAVVGPLREALQLTHVPPHFGLECLALQSLLSIGRGSSTTNPKS